MGAAVSAVLVLRATWLLVALVLALLVGEPLARFMRLSRWIQRLGTALNTLRRKLNKRDAATRAWRGVIVLLGMLLPAILLGLLIEQRSPFLSIATLTVIFGAGLMPWQGLDLWRQLQRNSFTLQVEAPSYLFPDRHGLIRYRILTRWAYMQIGAIGAATWYLVGGITALAAYLMLALAARHYRTDHAEHRAFGGVAQALWGMADMPPRVITHLLALVAAVLIPKTRPVAALKEITHGPAFFIAALLGVSLGGPMPGGEMAWVGRGTPKPEAAHARRLLLLQAITLLLWLLLLGCIALIS